MREPLKLEQLAALRLPVCDRLVDLGVYLGCLLSLVLKVQNGQPETTVRSRRLQVVRDADRCG